MSEAAQVTASPAARVSCAHCGLPVAAWRVDVDGVVYCTDHCARHAPGAAHEIRRGNVVASGRSVTLTVDPGPR